MSARVLGGPNQMIKVGLMRVSKSPVFPARLPGFRGGDQDGRQAQNAAAREVDSQEQRGSDHSLSVVIWDAPSSAGVDCHPTRYGNTVGAASSEFIGTLPVDGLVSLDLQSRLP